MDSLLARAGVDDEGKELSGPTQVMTISIAYIAYSETNRKFWRFVRIPLNALRLSACKLCGNETLKELENVPQGDDNSQLSYLHFYIWSPLLTISLSSEKRRHLRDQFIIKLLTSLLKLQKRTSKQRTWLSFQGDVFLWASRT